MTAPLEIYRIDRENYDLNGTDARVSDLRFRPVGGVTNLGDDRGVHASESDNGVVARIVAPAGSRLHESPEGFWGHVLLTVPGNQYYLTASDALDLARRGQYGLSVLARDEDASGR